MEISHLNEFRVLAEICNYQEAADQLYISLSSLSKHISKIEEELGVSLFNRTTRKVTLTEYGSVLYDYATEIVNKYNQCLRSLEDIKQEDSNQLSISFPPILTQYKLLEALSDFIHSNPGIHTTMTEHINPRELFKAQKCDIAFHTEYGQYHPLESSLFKQADTLAAVLPASHPLAGKAFISFDQLRDDEFIIKHDRNSVLSKALQKLASDCGFELKIAHAVKYSSAMVRMVSEEMGVAAMNRHNIPDSDKYNISIVEIRPEVPFNIYVMYTPARKNDNAILAFREYCTDVMNYTQAL